MKKIILILCLIQFQTALGAPFYDNLVENKYGIDFYLPQIENHSDRIDFAILEKKLPLNKYSRLKLTTDILDTYSGEELDQLFARLESGTFPDGYFEKKSLMPNDTGVANLVRKIGSAKGWIAEKLIEFLVDGTRGLTFNSKEKTVHSLGKGIYMWLITEKEEREQLKKNKYSQHSNKLYSQVFPAKMYCNIGAIDTRKESIIIDYTFSDDLDSYHQKPDHLLTRKGFKMKTEIREVHNNLFLGRVYMDNIFMYYIALEKFNYSSRKSVRSIRNINKNRKLESNKITRPSCGV